MTPKERRQNILDILARKTYLSVEELSKELYVSVPTVRRDLSLLEKEGSVRRTHGGVSYVSPEFTLESLDFRDRLNREGKRKIAELASTLIRDGDTMFLDSGSTCLALSRILYRIPDLTVVTNGILNVPPLLKCKNIHIELTGGILDIKHSCMVGRDAEALVRERHADLNFVSCSGIDATGGMTVIYEDDISLKRAFQKQSKKTVLMMDRSKFGRKLFYKVYDFSEVNYLVIDSPLPDDIRRQCELFEVEVVEE